MSSELREAGDAQCPKRHKASGVFATNDSHLICNASCGEVCEGNVDGIVRVCVA